MLISWRLDYRNLAAGSGPRNLQQFVSRPVLFSLRNHPQQNTTSPSEQPDDDHPPLRGIALLPTCNSLSEAGSVESAIKEWLRRRRGVQAPIYLLGALGLLPVGMVVVAFTGYLSFCLFYLGWFGIAAAWELASGHRLPQWPTKGIGIFTAGFMVLLFVSHARSGRWEVGDIPKGAWPGRRRKDDAEAFASLRATAKFVIDLFYTGPRLFSASWGMFRRALRLWKLDVDNCSQLLWLLVTAGRAVTHEELASRLADCDLRDLERQLKDIEGVVFLERGWTLTEELRSELAQRACASVRSQP